jgi:hypothetical protein
MTIDYGTDLDFRTLDMAADGGVISGNDILVQAVILRLNTPRGSVLDAPDDGMDLTDYLSRDLTTSDAASLAGTIESELQKDPRFQAGSVHATVDISGLTSEGEIDVTLSLDAGDGPFTLVLTAGAAGVVIAGGG